ncbi:TAF6L [Bugula neritina]|uniref:Histone H4 n=1 Tax=Bugula neritina TaxID=10212 RepID=A0A7J7IW31_BUGNE|nr:TAF6L [Bugula neritina]
MGDRLKRSISATENERKYLLVSAATIKMFAESRGHDLADDVVRVLTEDVNYRLRELVSEATQYMKQCPRTTLTIADISHALMDANVTPTINPLSGVAPLGRPTTSHDERNGIEEYLYAPSLSMFFPKDVPVELSSVVNSSTEKLPVLPESSMSHEVCYLLPYLNKSSPNLTLTPTLSAYFTAITESVIDPDAAVRKMALADVIRNSNIAHVQLQLLLWIQKWVEEACNSLRFRQLRVALDLLDALTNNNTSHLTSAQMDIIMNTLVNEICLSKWKISPVEQMDYQLHAVNILSKCLRRCVDFKVSNHYHQTLLSRSTECISTYTSGTLQTPAKNASVTSDQLQSQSITGALLLVTTALHPLALLELSENHITQLLKQPVAATPQQQVSISCAQSIIFDCVNSILLLSRGVAHSLTLSEKKKLEETQLYLCSLLHTHFPDVVLCRLNTCNVFTQSNCTNYTYSSTQPSLVRSHPGRLFSHDSPPIKIEDCFDIAKLSLSPSKIAINYGKTPATSGEKEELSRTVEKKHSSLRLLTRNLPYVRFRCKRDGLIQAKYTYDILYSMLFTHL